MCAMCCTLRPAELSKTVLYSGEAVHEGNLVHVIGYQNRAKNRFNGPNAMILPFPARAAMGPRNCLETEGLRWLMNDLAAAVKPMDFSRGMSKGMLTLGSARSVTVFESGAYTVVLAEDARDIPTALARVPENKRPDMNEEIFDAYAKWYPAWPIALCCFESRKELEPDPLLWWFEPLDESVLFAPALDSHNGAAPELGVQVRVDHSVVFGSTRTPRGVPVRFHRNVPKHVSNFIADRVVGDEFTASAHNGDFAIPLERLISMREEADTNHIKIARTLPPCARRPGATTLDLA
jgi:hypothetical protein